MKEHMRTITAGYAMSDLRVIIMYGCRHATCRGRTVAKVRPLLAARSAVQLRWDQAEAFHLTEESALVHA
jgi:hypothetical protein